MKKIFKIYTKIYLVIYLFFVLYLIFNWNNMPDIIGVHFDLGTEDNLLHFDVFDNKIYALYPYIINGIIMFVLFFVQKKINKIKTGLKVNEKGESLLRKYIQIFTLIFSFGASSFFFTWMYCVINQKYMYSLIPIVLANIVLINLLSIIPSVSAIKIIYNKKKN